MGQIVVDALNSTNGWTGLMPDDATPSAELAITTDTDIFRFGADRTSLRLSATAAALDHRWHWSFPDLDLSAYDELRFWIRSSRRADGSSAGPFYLEWRLASTAVPLSAPGNDWHRYLPVSQPGTWEMIRLNLRDLPDAVRGAVNLLQIRCLAATDFAFNLDDMIAVRQELLRDVDQALLASLHHRVTIAGTPVPAAIAHPGTPAPAPPYIGITPRALRLVPKATVAAEQHADFVNGGYHLLPATCGYALYYQIEGLAADRDQSARLYEYVLQTFSPHGHLVINNAVHRVEHVDLELDDTHAPVGTTRPTLGLAPVARGAIDRFFVPPGVEQPTVNVRVFSSRELGTPRRISTPYNQIDVRTGLGVP